MLDIPIVPDRRRAACDGLLRHHVLEHLPQRRQIVPGNSVVIFLPDRLDIVLGIGGFVGPLAGNSVSHAALLQLRRSESNCWPVYRETQRRRKAHASCAGLYSTLWRDAPDEDRKGCKLLLDEAARCFIGDFLALLVELRCAVADEDLRLVERE